MLFGWQRMVRHVSPRARMVLDEICVVDLYVFRVVQDARGAAQSPHIIYHRSYSAIYPRSYNVYGTWPAYNNGDRHVRDSDNRLKYIKYILIDNGSGFARTHTFCE